MRTWRGILGVVATLIAAFAVVASVRAGTVTAGPMTLVYPDYPLTGPALMSCEPSEEPSAKNVTLSGIPVGATVTFQFAWFNPYGGDPNFLPLVTHTNVVTGTIVQPILYPPDSSQWPLVNPTTNERALGTAVFVRVTLPGTTTAYKLVAKTWWARCLPPPPPSGGCTPGYWRQDQHFDSWVPTGYAPGDDFEVVFGVNASFDPHTLLDAVWLGGGGEAALARHAVAALLNAASPDVNFSYTEAQVIAGVQAAYASGDFETFKDQLDFANNAGCPIN